MAIPGSIIVIIVVLMVKSSPLDVLKWLVFVVIFYSSGAMLRAGLVPKELSMDLEKSDFWHILKWPYITKIFFFKLVMKCLI